MSKLKNKSAMLFGFILVALFNVILAIFILGASTPYMYGVDGSSPFWLWFLPFFGLVQMIHVVPLHRALTRRGYLNVREGVVLGATMTLMINASYLIIAAVFALLWLLVR